MVERLCKPETHTVSHRKTEKKERKATFTKYFVYFITNIYNSQKHTQTHTHITTSNYLQKIPSNEGEDQS